MGGRAGGGAGMGSRSGIGATEAGYSSAMARGVVAAEKMINGNDFETLKIFDDQGNVTYEKKGAKDHVYYDGWKSVNKVVTHNHPSGSAFSGADLKNAVALNQKEIRATGKEFTFSMKRPASGWGVKPSTVIRKFNKIHKENSKKYWAQKTGNAAADRKLWIKLSTDTSQQVAKAYGWNFTVKKNK